MVLHAQTGSPHQLPKVFLIRGPMSSLTTIQIDLHPAYANSQGISESRRSNRTGFIAQELANVFPEAVEETKGVQMFENLTSEDLSHEKMSAIPEGNKSRLKVDNLLTVDLEPVLFDLIAEVIHSHGV